MSYILIEGWSVLAGQGHLYLVYDDARVVRAGPEDYPLPFGDIVAEAGTPIEDSADAREPDEAAERGSRMVDIDPGRVDAAWSAMVQFAEELNDAGMAYDLLDDNSNAFVNTALDLVGVDLRENLPLPVDDVSGYVGSDHILAFDFRIVGTAGGDLLNGRNGDQTFVGRAGSDTLSGGDGNDVLNGGTGADVLRGGSGDDRFLVDRPRDVIVELQGEGTDLAISSADYVLPRNVEDLRLTGAQGHAGTGNGDANTIAGSRGGDSLRGGRGDDSLSGGAGDDTLRGGAGEDELRGGKGADLFVFDRIQDGGDHILDFRPDQGDRLAIDTDAFGGAAGAAVSVVTGADKPSPTDERETILISRSTGETFFDPDGSGPLRDVLIAVIVQSAHTETITGDDILLV